uniref:Uncharacterized protein n=1 Tax=Timema cristinae TaxID=61476 RepID=A0A7R9H3V1_TIMCR|nr:unnamed protein product [Timema cristinae]
MELIEPSAPITYSTSSTTSSSAQDGGKGEVRTWLDGLNSPLIQDEGDKKLLKLRFDVSQYSPEEIIVKTVDNKLLVRDNSTGRQIVAVCPYPAIRPLHRRERGLTWADRPRDWAPVRYQMVSNIDHSPTIT